MRTANPALSSDAWRKPQTWDELGQPGPGAKVAAAPARTMTVSGTVNATIVLIGLTTAAAIGGWMVVDNNPGLMHPLWISGALGGLAIGFFLRFTPKAAAYLAPVYALLEGAFLGPFSYLFAKWIAPEIIFQALILTFGILFTLLLAYRVGLIRVSGAMQRMVVAATGGVMFLYLAVFLLQLFGVGNIPFVHQLFAIQGAGWLGIGFTCFCIVLASFNLVMDFQFIEEGARQGLPKYMEWFGAFALLVTLVWLYIEIVRLLAKLRSSD